MQSRTQDAGHDIGQQLAGGIRYFDLRPHRYGNGQFWTYHGSQYVYIGGRLCGPGGILAQVGNYMNNVLGGGDRELVILNISHFSGFTQNAHHTALIQEIQNQVGAANLVQHTQAQINLFGANYSALLVDGLGNTQSRVAILYDGALDTGIEDYVFNNHLPTGFFKISPKYNNGHNAVNQIYLYDHYANSGNLGAMRTDQLNKLTQRGNCDQRYSGNPNRWLANAVGGTANTSHLFSWTLTPQPFGTPIGAAQNQSNPALEGLFTGPNWGGGGYGGGAPYNPLNHDKINIIYVDYYNSHARVAAGRPHHNYAMPVALAHHLNTYTDNIGMVAANWPGWGAGVW